MGLIQKFLRTDRGSPEEPATQPADPGASRAALTRDLLRVALRDTLRHHGIPLDWLSCDLFSSTTRNGTAGFHWRLIVRHWDPRLVVHAPAIEEALFQRLATLDPEAADWLTGISWQFAIADRTACPKLPDPTIWATRLKPPRQRGPGHDVDSARADLNRWLARRDSELPGVSQPAPWSSSQPSKP